MEQIIPYIYLEKSNEICKIIRSILKQQKFSLNNFQKMAANPQHVSFGMHGGQGLIRPIKKSMQSIPPFIIHQKVLSDWRIIVTQLSTHLTSVIQLVQGLTSYVGYSDACKIGAGGVWVFGIKK